MPLLSHRAVGMLATLGAVGCSSGRIEPTPVPPVARAACTIGEAAAPARTVLLAAAGPADSAMVLNQRRLPPALLDCSGVLVPGAARSWSADSSGRSWTLVFGDQAPDAAAVAADWREGAPAEALRFAGAQSLVPLDRHRLVATFDRRADTLPLLFVDPALAVALDSAPTMLALAPVESSDPRDALDRGVDLLRTSDPTVLDYARADSAFAITPLSWNRTYVLLLPAAGLSLPVPADSARFRAALARDAVPAEARGAAPPFWWEQLALCPGRRPPPRAGSAPLEAIGYRRNDPVARALAERIVGLVEGSFSARGLSPGELDAMLAGGAARGFVLAVPRPAPVPCRVAAHWPPGSQVIPLVDTRASAVWRRGLPALAADFDGTLRPVPSP